MGLHHHRLDSLGRLIAADDANTFGDQTVGLQYLAHLGELLLDVACKVPPPHGQCGEQIAQSHRGANAACAGRTLLNLSLVIQLDF